MFSPVVELERYQPMTANSACGLEIDRSDLRHTRVVQIPEQTIESGQVLLSLEKFSFTANNVSYGLFGDALKYWKFFPATSQGWANLPVWGFATVEESLHNDIEPGERFYGYFPMATSVVLTPGETDDYGFYESAPAREHLPSFYNRYIRVSSDPSYRADYENQQLLFRPLFLTAFVLDQHLKQMSFYGVDQIVISSASSKTAMALAWLLRKNDMQVVGLTSKTGRAFAKNSQNYDDVLLYDEIADKLPYKSSIFLDFTGSPERMMSVHTALRDALKVTYRVGTTHWQDASPYPEFADLPGPKPKFFAATAEGDKLTEEWGLQELQERVWEKLLEFYGPASQWIKTARGIGTDAILECYDRVLHGKVLPSEGFVLSFDV